jgi:hypothetical protein
VRVQIRMNISMFSYLYVFIHVILMSAYMCVWIYMDTFKFYCFSIYTDDRHTQHTPTIKSRTEHVLPDVCLGERGLDIG